MDKKTFRMDIDPGAAAVIRTLQDAGFSAYAVGGCVRDSLMHKMPHDWDICSSAKPEEVLAVFGEKRCIPTGMKHGTITVRQDGGFFEVTTFRTEGIYTDGRHPDEVAYIAQVEGDLARRDFTMNAMAYNDDEGLVDPFGGAEDLLIRRKIRAVGDPMQRFGEDALRIMRLFRFAAREQLDVDDDTLRAAIALRENLRRISAERIREELLGLLAAQKPGRFMLPEIFGVILPELGGAALFDQAVRLTDAAPVIREVRLAALLAPVADRAETVMRRLKFDTKTMTAVRELTALAQMTPEAQEDALRIQARRFLGAYGEERASQLAALRAAQIVAGEGLPGLDGFLAMTREVRRLGLCCGMKELAVSGELLRREAGVLPGPGMGALLARLLEDVITGRLPNEKEALLEAARMTAERQ